MVGHRDVSEGTRAPSAHGSRCAFSRGEGAANGERRLIPPDFSLSRPRVSLCAGERRASVVSGEKCVHVCFFFFFLNRLSGNQTKQAALADEELPPPLPLSILSLDTDRNLLIFERCAA